MSLNCNEINLILDELNLNGSFIQEVVQPGYDTLAFSIYKSGEAKTVIICTRPNACRINSTNKKIPRNEKPLRFMEFLRSRIRGSKILNCRQIGFERIIKMELSRNAQNEYGNNIPDVFEEFDMFIRLWSNAGNVIVCDKNGMILDSMYRRPQKGEITGGKFSVEEKILSEEETAGILQKFPIRTFDELAANYHAEKSASKTSALPDGQAKVSTTAKPLSFNQKVDLWYSEYASSLSREALLEQAEKWYNARKSRQENALERLIAKQKDFQNSAKFKHYGDLILAFGYNLQQSQNFLECVDYETNSPIRIKIDPKKSVQENAADYYERYKKESSGALELETEIELAKNALAALEKAYERIKNEKNPIKIEQLLRRDSKPKQQEKKTHPGLDYTIDGWYILVGRDSNENDDLLRHYVKGPDLWMHTRDCPGGFVFIKARANKTVPLKILLYAGNLAVYYSKARKAGKADLYYTHVKHLRRAKNGPKGLVLPTQEKNLTIELDNEILRDLDRIKAEQNF